MRLLMWHCDRFRSELTEKGRSSLREESAEPVIEAENCLLVYAACEKQDEANPSAIIDRAAEEIAKLASQVGATSVVVHSFAHLFVELSSPRTALEILRGVERSVAATGLTALRTPFGWFNTLEIKAKGHPISRVAREIHAE